MKKFFALIFVLTILCQCLAGCSNDSPVMLTMWHNYGGEMQLTMDYLIDEFNATVGKDQGIIVNVMTISSSSELNKSLTAIANNDPGAQKMPDIFTGYPDIGIQFYEKNMLANLDEYFTEEELSQYVEEFVAEGRLSDGSLYVFPISKSTEVLYVNQTLFDEFAAATDADASNLATFEGIAKLSEQYYNWCGKQFFTADSWFNIAEVGMAQLGGSIFEGKAISLNGDSYAHIFETFYTPAVKGGIAVYNGYSSDLSKTGEIVCSTGSSAGILFYGDTITYSDGTVKKVDYNILPYPVFENGTKTALQRGGGLMVAKSNEKKERAASVFIKWLTDPEQNMRFVTNTGYLPVTKTAFEEQLYDQIKTIKDARIKTMLKCVLSMYEEYNFFFAPSYSTLDEDSNKYEQDFMALLTEEHNNYKNGNETSVTDALAKFRK